LGLAIPSKFITPDFWIIIQAVVISDSAGNFEWPGPVEGPFDSIRASFLFMEYYSAHLRNISNSDANPKGCCYQKLCYFEITSNFSV
jgi:hypothetical protein